MQNMYFFIYHCGSRVQSQKLNTILAKKKIKPLQSATFQRLSSHLETLHPFHKEHNLQLFIALPRPDPILYTTLFLPRMPSQT